MLLKCCTQYASKFGNLSSGHRTGKVVFIAIPKKGDFKECSTTTQLHSSHILPKWFIQASLQQYMNCEILYVQAGFRKDRGRRDQTANIHWVIRKQENSRNTPTSALLTMQKPLTVNHNKLWKTHRDCNTRPSYLPSEKSVCKSRSNS